jgi:hypothetical protein
MTAQKVRQAVAVGQNQQAQQRRQKDFSCHTFSRFNAVTRSSLSLA